MHDMQRYLVEEFAEEYLDGKLPRRDLLRRVLLMTGSAAITASALAGLGIRARGVLAAARPPSPLLPQPASPPLRLQQTHGTDPPPAISTLNVVDPNDPAIIAGPITYGGAAGDVFGYLAQPAATGYAYPAIVVVHENRGLIEPNMDIARRYAKEGYVALAPDLVSRAGGTPALAADPAQATGFLGRADPNDLVSDLLSGLSWLGDQAFVDAGHLGATGFCFGGGLVWLLTEAAPNLSAAVPFYGPTPSLANVPDITASILGIYAELDTRITNSSLDLDTALDAAGVNHAKWIAPGANHAFFNNTGAAYNPADAVEGWHRALDWFATYL